MKLVIILIFFGSVKTKKCINRGYYWRDFKADVPADAFFARHDNLGNPVYIGQTSLDYIMLPGEIFRGDVNVYVTYKGRVTPANNNVKILCCSYQKQLKWETSNNTELEDIDKELIRGGFIQNDYVYIGRKRIGKKTFIGWIPFRIYLEDRILHYFNNGRLQKSRYFEVLVYDNKV